MKAGAFEAEHEEYMSKVAENEAKLKSEFPEGEKPEEDDVEESVQAKSDKTDSNDGIAGGEPETATDDEQEKLDELEKLLEGRFTRTNEPADESGEREAKTPDDAQNENPAENGRGAELGAEASDEETTEVAEAGNVDEANVKGPNGNPENEAECESNEASQEAHAGENAADPVDETNTTAPEAEGEESMEAAVEGATEPEAEPHDGEADAQSAEPGEQIALKKGGTRGSLMPAENVERAVMLEDGNDGLIELLNQIRNQEDGRRNNDKVMLPKAHDKILAVASTANGLGCTALSLHLANELADLGMTVAVAMASKRDLNRMVAGMSEEMQTVHECGHRWRGFDVYFWDDERKFGDEYEVVVADCGKLDLTDTTPNSPANLFLNKADQKVLLFGGAPWILQAPLELMQRVSRKQGGSWLLAAREVERNVQREFKTLLDTWFTDAEPHVWEVPNRPRFFQDEKGFGDYKPAIDKVLSEDARKRVRESEKKRAAKKKKQPEA